jgi:mannosyl-3-phosphoglycerate phosphatase
MTTPKLIIFTDLDGTLLDRDTYSFEAAIPVLRVLKQNAIPLVLTSSKTRAEIELYRKKLENHHPFISENGGAIFVPKGYFSFQFPCDRESEGYLVLELGTFYPLIIGVLNSIKKETGIRIRAFSDLTEEELTSLCGLSLREAEFAKKREYDEPFMIEGGKREVEMVKEKIEEKGMNYVWGGRFHHIFGKNDKGKAVEILKELYENEFFSISTVGVGNSLNDLPMLLAVDHPVFLKGREDHPLEIPLKIQNLTILDGTGPFVWKEALLSLLKKVKI